jgi:hypothetical protein
MYTRTLLRNLEQILRLLWRKSTKLHPCFVWLCHVLDPPKLLLSLDTERTLPLIAEPSCTHTAIMSTASSSRIPANAEPVSPTLPDVSGVKHALSDTEDDEAPHPKRLRNLGAEASKDSLNSTKDRKKRPKKRKRKVPVVQSTSGPSSPTRERERESVVPVVSLSRPSSVAPLAETNVNTSMRQRTAINLRALSEGPTASGSKIPRNLRVCSILVSESRYGLKFESSRNKTIR